MDAALVYEYFKGTIATRSERLTFFHQGRLIKRYPYTVTEPRGKSYRSLLGRDVASPAISGNRLY
jgi:hypothetical protein